MAPKADRKELLEKLQAAKGKDHKAKKDPKAKALEKAEAEAKAVAAKQAKKGGAAGTGASAVAKAAAAPAPAAPVPAAPAAPVSVFAQEGEEAQQIGIHLGISCDGCGQSPPLIGRAMKCMTCPDFDLCETCYPFRCDKQREAVATAAGRPPDQGRHPSAHVFGARRAPSVLTREVADKEILLAEEDRKVAAAKAAAEPAPQRSADPRAAAAARRAGAQARDEKEEDAGVAPYPEWTPVAADCPCPRGWPSTLGPLGLIQVFASA